MDDARTRLINRLDVEATDETSATGSNAWAHRLSRRTFITGGLAASAALLAACGSSGSGAGNSTNAGGGAPPKAKIDGDLFYYNYAEYVPPKVISGFEKEYGVKVHQTFYSSVDEVVAKVGSGAPYDIAWMASYELLALAQAGVIRRIDHDQLSNWDQVTPYFQNPPYDPQAMHFACPYAYGAVGLAWVKDKIPSVPATWKSVWNLAPKYKGNVYVYDDHKYTMAMALAYLGKNVNSHSSADINAAAEALIKLKPDLGEFIGFGDTQQLQQLQLWLTMAYTGDVYTAYLGMKNPEQVGFTLCHEASLGGTDNVIIPTAAKHPGTAMVFCDYLLRPENMAQAVEYIGYPVPTKAGLKAYSQHVVQKFPALDFPLSTLEDYDSWAHNLPTSVDREWSTAFAKVKAA